MSKVLVCMAEASCVVDDLEFLSCWSVDNVLCAPGYILFVAYSWLTCAINVIYELP